MTTDLRFRGHAVKVVDEEWYFCDSGEPVSQTYRRRGCGHCLLQDTSEGHDGCLGTLPEVMNACCGHGEAREAYVQFPDGTIVSGVSAVDIIAELKKQQ